MLHVKSNFSHLYSNDDESINCQYCSTDKIQTQEHIIYCEKISHSEETVSINYADLLNSDLQRVKSCLTKYQETWQEWIRDEAAISVEEED